MKSRPNMLGTINVKDDETYMTNPYPQGFKKVNMPEGKSGDWRVKKFEVTRSAVGLYNLRLIRDGFPGRVIPPGNYTRLTCCGAVVMSDTPAEAHEHYKALHNAKGDVLINGLGLGFFLTAVLNKTSVGKVTVIEKSKDVLKLVAPAFKKIPHVEIIEADALQWRPPVGVHYGYVWHDIWNDICDDNKSEMTKLKRAYSRKCDSQGCWSQEYL